MHRLATCRVWLPLMLALGLGPSLLAQATVDGSGDTLLLGRDASGRVQSRTSVKADGTRQETSILYWEHGSVPRRTTDETFDRGGRLARRIVEEFDSRGRLRVRRSAFIGVDGEESGALTRYSYDPQGQRSEITTDLGRRGASPGRRGQQ